MSLDLCILGSGSSGNSTVVRAPQGAFLIDAGFGPRTTAQRLHGTGVEVEHLAGIVCTHLDHDHFNFHWLQTLVRHRIRVHIHESRLKAFLKAPEIRDLDAKLAAGRVRHAHPEVRQFADLVSPFEDQLEPVKNVRMMSLALAHDESGSHGFLIECDGTRVGFATDLGHVPEVLIERFCGVDVLALESNYDPEMELQSDRPWYLKNRIMNGKGHLSNFQALEAIQAILDRTSANHGPNCLPRHIVLLHRSRQCNCPKLVKKLFSADPRISPILTLTDQYERTGWLSSRRPRTQAVEQLTLTFA
jgi:phosphoribosyl 1,2-cyclic phosphodiesterase